jgi:hypothetical protein
MLFSGEAIVGFNLRLNAERLDQMQQAHFSVHPP